MASHTAPPLVPATLPVPLRVDEHGTIRVGDSRLTLETVIYTYLDGASPETLAQECFPDLSLVDAYTLVAFYLQNKAQVQGYLAAQAERAQAARATTGSRG